MSLLKQIAPVNYFATSFNLITIILMICLIVFNKNFPPMVPLWFSFNWGLDRLANPTSLWILPTLVLVFSIASHVLSKIIAGKHGILSQILVWTTAFLSLVFLLSTYKIILLVS